MQVLAAISNAAEAPFALERLELGEPRPDEVLVRIVASGVCHTDIKFKESWDYSAGPVVLGHEGAGIVEAVGPEVSGIAAGDHVLLSYRSCGRCTRCETGHPTYCETMNALNFGCRRPDGTTTLRRGDETVFGPFFGQSSFASHTLTSARNIVKVDDDLDLALAAPLGCGLITGAGTVLNVLRPPAGSTLAVVGAGGVGMAALMAAVACDVRVIAVDPVAQRRELALSLGASDAVDPHTGPVAEQIRELTGDGAPFAFDTTGVIALLNDTIASLAPLGTAVTVAVNDATVPLDVLSLMRSGRSLRGAIEGDAIPQQFIPQLLELHAQGRFPMERLQRRYPLAQINDAVADSHSGATIKPVLVMD